MFATGVSADGLTIAGYGFNPNGGLEAWIASLRQDVVATPEPAALGLLGLGLAGLASLRRRRAA